MFDWFLGGIGVLWLFVASIFDIKTMEVPDWLNYSLMVIGLGSRLIYSMAVSDYSFILYGLLGFGVFVGVGFVMYYAKQWGGGDCKLIMGLGALYGTGPSFVSLEFPFLLVLVLNLLIVGGLYGLIWSLFLMVKSWNKFVKDFVKESFLDLKIGLIVSVLILIVSLIFNVLIYGLIMGVLFMLSVVLLRVIRVVEKVCMYRRVNVNKLVEGDWVGEDVKVNGKVICSPSDICLNKKQINLLKKHKRKVLIKHGIPFVPSFFIALIVTLVVGNLFQLVLF